MAPNPPSTHTDSVSGKDKISGEKGSMLLRYLHDNTAFSDRLVELTVNHPATKGQATVPDNSNADTAQQKKDDDKAPGT